MSVWLAEVHVNPEDSEIPLASAYSSGVPLWGFGLRAAGSSNRFILEVFLRWTNSYGPVEWETVVNTRTGATITLFNELGALITLDSHLEGTGQDGAGFRDPGVLQIEKNGDLGTFTFRTPLGNFGGTLASIGEDTTTPLRVEEIGVLLIAPSPAPSPDPDISMAVRWTSFWSSADGVRFRGAAMTTLQPGTWGAFINPTTVGDGDFPFTANQEAGYYFTELSHTEGDGLDGVRDIRRRPWNGGDAFDFFTRELDQTWAPEHGIVWRLFSTSREPETLFVERSFDNGETWEQFVVDSEPANFPRNPNIVWFAGELYAIWTVESLILLSRSEDFGRNWSEPEPKLAFASLADNPRLRVCVDPKHGTLYFFMRNLDSELILHRSFDRAVTFRDDPTAVLVFGDCQDFPIDAFAAQDHSIRVRYISGDNRHADVSIDHGSNWVGFELLVILLDRNWRTTVDWQRGLSYHVAWRPTVPALQAYGSADFGTLELIDQAGNTVDDTVAEQTAGISMLADGRQLVSYFDADEVLTEKRSEDFAATWE